MELEKKLVELRKKNGLSQLKVAEELDVSRQAISKWEMGSAVPSPENLKLLSKLYKVSLDYLMDDDAEEPDQATDHGQKGSKKQRALAMKKAGLLAIALLAIALLVAVVLIILTFGQGEEEKARPIKELEQEEVTIFPEEAFPMVGIE